MNDQLLKTFKAFTYQNGIKILAMPFLEKLLFVCELRQVLHLTPSTISAHLTILHNAGFITRKQKRSLGKLHHQLQYIKSLC